MTLFNNNYNDLFNFKESLEDPKSSSNLINLFLLDFIDNLAYIRYSINNNKNKKINKIIRIITTVLELIIENIYILFPEFDNS
jgi:hypothetical protein